MMKILTGQTIILYYASDVFGEIYANKIEESILIYISVRLFVACLMLCIAESFGRRSFMLYSTIFMFLGLFLAFFGFRFGAAAVSIIGVFISGCTPPPSSSMPPH